MRVFISYSFKDEQAARALCAQLERRGISCWVAFRDVPPGMFYGKCIVEAIERSDAVLYLLSKHSLASEQVQQELYLGNSLQKRGLHLFPILLSEVALEGSFRYVLQGKQRFRWHPDYTDEDYSPLVASILRSNAVKEKTPELNEVPSVPHADASVAEGLILFYRALETKKSRSLPDVALYPSVRDHNDWLGKLNLTLFFDSIQLARSNSNWNCLYVGKSGSGKTTALHAYAKKSLQEIEWPLAIRVPVKKLALYTGTQALARYISDTYLAPFGIPLSAEEVQEWLFLREARGLKPRIVVMIDGLSDSSCGNNTVQNSIDSLLSCPDVQVIFMTASIIFPYSIGDIALQRFDIQKLTRRQVDTYLSSLAVGVEDMIVPYGVLTSPLLLSLYANTLESKQSLFGSGDTKTSIKTEIAFEADILWNYFELLTEQCLADADVNSREDTRFIIEFGLPYLAFTLSVKASFDFSLKSFINAGKHATCLLEEDAFTDVFDSYLDLEGTPRFSVKDYRHILEVLLGERFGVVEQVDKGKWVFSSIITQDYLAASYVYRCILVYNAAGKKAPVLKSAVFPRIVLKYLGELLKSDMMQSDKLRRTRHPKALLDALSLFRDCVSERDKYGVSNVFRCLSQTSDNDLRGIDFSRLDLRRVTFSHLQLGDKDDSRNASSFEHCLVDEWTFRTIGFSNDQSPVCFSPDGCFLLAARGSIGVDIYHKASGWEHLAHVLDNRVIQAITINSKNEAIIETLQDGIYLIGLQPSKIVALDNQPIEGMCGKLALVDDDTVLLSTRDGRVLSVNIRSGNANLVHSIEVNALVVEKGGAILIANRDRGFIEVDLQSRGAICSYRLPDTDDSYITQVHVSPDGRRVSCSTKQGSLLQWFRGAELDETSLALDSPINDFIYISNNAIACLTETQGVTVVSTDMAIHQKLALPKQSHWSKLAVSPDYLAASSLEGELFIFDREDASAMRLRDYHQPYRIPYLAIENCNFSEFRCEEANRERIQNILSTHGALQ